MKRLARAVAVAIALAVAGAAAAAPLDPAKIAAINKAAETFLAIGKDAYRTGKPPRQADPEVAPLLDTIFDLDPVNVGGPVPLADFDKLADWVAAVAAVGMVYTFAGTGIADMARPPDDKQREQMSRNAIAYSAELGRFYDAALQLQRAGADCFMAEIGVHPDQFGSPPAKAFLDANRSAFAQTIGGVIRNFLAPGREPEWSAARLITINAVAASAAKFLTLRQRHELEGLAGQVANQLGNTVITAGLAKFAQALAE